MTRWPSNRWIFFRSTGFRLGLYNASPTFLGLLGPIRTFGIGSGGWANIIDKFRKAKAFCDHPFEIRHRGLRKEIVPVEGEWIGDHLKRRASKGKAKCQAVLQRWPRPSFPRHHWMQFHDPPYFGNVQYAELMDFCYVWLRRLIQGKAAAFSNLSTRHPQELTETKNGSGGLITLLRACRSLSEMAAALKPGAPLAFTYHHNDLYGLPRDRRGHP